MISHRDMVRAFERLFRRVRVPLAMTQGFHPRPQLTFPDALSLGVQGLDEVTDIVVEKEIDTDELHRRLSEQAPPGLVIHGVRTLGPQERKVKVASMDYSVPLPPQHVTRQLEDAIEVLRDQQTLSIERKGKQVEIDLKETLCELCLGVDHLRMSIRPTGQSQLQPRDLLAALGLQDLLREGAILSRTKVELTQ